MYAGIPMETREPEGPDFACAVSSRDGGTVVEVWAVPGASKTEISGVHGGAVRIRVSAPPEGGRANRALVDLLETITGGEVQMIGGRSSRRKRFFVREMSSTELMRRFAEQTG